MYHYSLEWTGQIYMSSIDNSEKFDNISTRISEIKAHFTFNLFENVCQGLLEEDRWIFAFLLAQKAVLVSDDLLMTFLKATPIKCSGKEDYHKNMEIAMDK